MIENLPLVNAILNGTACVLLVCGWRNVRRGRVAAHVICMLSAVLVSALFLTSYVIYHYQHGHTVFTAQGWPRVVYFAVLATHVPLAILMVVPILVVLWLAATARFATHRRLARIVLPVWIYVSVTGVVIYLWLYRFFPPT